MIGWIKRCLRRFARGDSGGVIVIFALTVPAALGLVGMSVDYGSWLKQKTKMQGVADAAALAAAKVYSDTQDSNAAQSQATSTVNALGLSGASTTAALVTGGGGYQVTLQKQGVKYFSGIILSLPFMILRT